MNKLLIILLFPICVMGQDKCHPYVEVNSGFGFDYWSIIHSTAAVSAGTTIEMGDYSLIDLQIGIGIPSIVTGKVGLGSYFGKNECISLIIGCRPYPLMIYSQINIGQIGKFQFMASSEIGGGGPKSLDFRYLHNIGFRWPIKIN